MSLCVGNNVLIVVVVVDVVRYELHRGASVSSATQEQVDPLEVVPHASGVSSEPSLVPFFIPSKTISPDGQH